MRGSNYSSRPSMKWKYLIALTIIASASTLGLSISFSPTLTFAETQRTLPAIRGKNNSSTIQQKLVSPSVKKPHRLIRRPTPAMMPTPLIEKAPTSIAPAAQPQDSTLAQNKDASLSKSPLPTAVGSPLPSSFIGQIVPLQAVAAPTPITLIGSATPTTRTAAAVSDPSPPSAPPSMRRLFAEIPGIAQITEYEDPDPTVTTPTIARNPATMSFSAVQNGSAPATQTLTISNGGPGTLAWTASSNSGWLKLNNTASVSGNNLGSVNVGVAPSGLTVGTHSGVITIVGAGAANSPQTMTVTLDITAAPTPTIGLSATALSFSAVQGGSNPANKTISVSNSGNGTLTWTATESSSWLNLSPASGTGNGTITVSIVTTGMTAGTYSTPITIAATGATNTPQTVTVSLTLTTPPTIGFSPTSMVFTAAQGGTNPASQSLSISNTGSGTLNWTASDNAAWLSLAPASGTGNGTVTLTAATGSLTAGTYSGIVTLSATGATTVSIPITFNITAASTLTVAPSTLSYTATQGGSNPVNQTIAVTSNGTWTATKNGSWLTITPTSGSGNGTITVSVNAAQATAGTNTGTITITGGGITRTVSVTLTLNATVTSSATLTWAANGESDLAGYKVYRATASGAYGAPIATLQGNVVTYVATGLQSGTTYFFVVTAYDSAGNESPVSNEVSKSVF